MAKTGEAQKDQHKPSETSFFEVNGLLGAFEQGIKAAIERVLLDLAHERQVWKLRFGGFCKKKS